MMEQLSQIPSSGCSSGWSKGLRPCSSASIHSALELLPEGQASPLCSGVCHGEAEVWGKLLEGELLNRPLQLTVLLPGQGLGKSTKPE